MKNCNNRLALDGVFFSSLSQDDSFSFEAPFFRGRLEKRCGVVNV